LDSFDIKTFTENTKKEKKPKPVVKPKQPLSTEDKISTNFYAVRGETALEQLENMITHILKLSAMHEQDIINTINYQKLQSSKNNKLPEISDLQIHKILNKLCVNINTLYILKTTGDTDLDLFRMVLVDLMKENNGKIKKGDIFKKWEQELGVTPSAGIYTKVMQEISKSKAGGQWTLK
jgi:hypothetical protein